MVNAQEYVDLGLPSGTLWKDKNEDGGFYRYDEAISKYGSALPTKEQFEELKYSCQWIWTGNGYKVIGPSGKSIFLPAEGYRKLNGEVIEVGEGGNYWSSTPYGSREALYCYFNSGKERMYIHYLWRGHSIRIVKN